MFYILLWNFVQINLPLKYCNLCIIPINIQAFRHKQFLWVLVKQYVPTSEKNTLHADRRR